MFIDGNSVPLPPTDTNKPQISSKINSLNDSNSNKASSRKKTRKSTKSSTNDNENKTTIDQDNQTITTTHFIVDIPNPSVIEQQNISTESQSNPINVINSTNMNVSN